MQIWIKKMTYVEFPVTTSLLILVPYLYTQLFFWLFFFLPQEQLGIIWEQQAAQWFKSMLLIYINIWLEYRSLREVKKNKK